jgi:hypothetical protein
MAKKQVLLSICDRCHFEIHTALEKLGKSRRDRYVLPPGWLNVSGNTATHTVFEMDLCEDCKGVVLDAAGSARRS